MIKIIKIKKIVYFLLEERDEVRSHTSQNEMFYYLRKTFQQKCIEIKILIQSQ